VSFIDNLPTRVLAVMMKDSEAKVREGSTKAIGIASNDPNFRKAVLQVLYGLFTVPTTTVEEECT